MLLFRFLNSKILLVHKYPINRVASRKRKSNRELFTLEKRRFGGNLVLPKNT